MRSTHAARFPGRQGGATLVIALLILVLIMMIGITAVSTSNTQYKLAGNLQFEDSALNNSEYGSGTALAPRLLKLSRKTAFCITRSLMPSRSSILLTGRLLLVKLRKPFSQ